MQIIILLEVSCKNINNKVKKLTTIGEICPLTQKKYLKLKKKIHTGLELTDNLTLVVTPTGRDGGRQTTWTTKLSCSDITKNRAISSV